MIATLALADGFEGYLRDHIATQTDAQSIAISSRTQNIRDGFAFPNNGYPVFGLRDAADLQAALGATADVTMSVAGSTIVDGPREAAHAASATATLANFLLFGRRDVYAGRYFADAEVSHNTQVVVLSYKLAAELSPTGDPSAMVGREVRVRGRTMTAIGVMPSYAGEATFGSSFRCDKRRARSVCTTGSFRHSPFARRVSSRSMRRKARSSIGWPDDITIGAREYPSLPRWLSWSS